ncbi:MAG: MbnP family protein [Flavobacteriales bacterium]
MKKILFTLTVIALMTSCKKDEVSPEPMAEATPVVNFMFQQDYKGTSVTSADFGATTYTNEKGTMHTITKLQYLVSNITLHKTNGEEVILGGYNFVDLTDSESMLYTPTENIPEGTYTGVSLTFGFTPTDNVNGAYPDLNAASWSWPMMIGGGYHFMKFEGNFTNNMGNQTGFAYHNGTASKMNPNGTRTSEANDFRVRLWDFEGGFEIKDGNKTTININMDIAEWFKSPITWSLDDYHAMLMPNYTAQKMMNQNGRSVFSFGGVVYGPE